jgi:hypothetical protein
MQRNKLDATAGWIVERTIGRGGFNQNFEVSDISGVSCFRNTCHGFINFMLDNLFELRSNEACRCKNKKLLDALYF